MTDHESYYRQRIEEELAAADGCTEAGIAQIHHELAERYRQLIVSGGLTGTLPTPPQWNGAGKRAPARG